MSRVELAPRAKTQAQQIEAWWRRNRPGAPTLFVDELAMVIERLSENAHLGTRYVWTGSFDVGRVLLPRSKYHVYHSYEAELDLVKVRAIWHAARGRDPRLQ